MQVDSQSEEMDVDEGSMEEDVSDTIDLSRLSLDCYPYSFTPLLLFCNGYFDRGYSNYNAVAAFFESSVPMNMLDRVIYEQKNMLYEDLLEHIIQNQCLVVCCIEAHFTAFQVLKNTSKPTCIYYDPLSPALKFVPADSFKQFAIFKLMKCHYGDSQHIQENKDHYTGTMSSNLRRMIYTTWKKINTTDRLPYSVKTTAVPLNLNRHILINDRANPSSMSTQLTSNTCYFQVFLFAVLCKLGEPALGRDKSSIDIFNVELLEETSIRMSQFLLTFFVTDTVMRPLTNSNVVVDFYRYQSASYYFLFTKYLASKRLEIPSYESQYHILLQYFSTTKKLHTYGKFTLDGAMSSSPNTKSLQFVCGCEGAALQLARSDYYKYRAANLMFGFNSNMLASLENFSQFNSLRKNQLLRYTSVLKESLGGCATALNSVPTSNLYRDYYFMPQFEVGQQELIDVHHYTYMLDLIELEADDTELIRRVHEVNHHLVEHIYFSTQKHANYDKMLSVKDFKKSKKVFRLFLNAFMTTFWFEEFIALGFGEINPKEKEINSLTQTVFYTTEMMQNLANRQSYEFEKECINQMARSTLRKCQRRVDGEKDANQEYTVSLKIGLGFTYTKYNTLMHFLNVVECYWQNPDLSNIQVFGKDIRVLLAISCQKIFFDQGHCGFYHYGPIELPDMHGYGNALDLAVAVDLGTVVPSVSRKKRKKTNQLIITDRVYEFQYLKQILEGLFDRAQGERFKSDNEVLNLCLLSLMLDFGLYEEHVSLLHLPFLQCLQHQADTRELQVEIANLIYEFDRKNTSDSVTRAHIQELLFETSYKFIVNKGVSVQSRQFKLIRILNSDPDYQSYVLFCKIYMSLCQINRSTEVDYYKVHCCATDRDTHEDGEFKIIIPHNFSKATSDYLEEVTRRYTFSETDGIMIYDDLPVFDLRPQQPEINLHRVRFDSATEIQSMVKYMEVTNVFRVEGSKDQYLVFIADNVLSIDVAADGGMNILINKIEVEVATIFFNEAISFVPCFKYAESEDVVLFTSPNIHYLVDKGGQFAADYYGMKHELMECIFSDEIFVDLNDETSFKQYKLSELLTESKTVVFYPDYLLQVWTRQQLIDLLDLAVKVRNVSFFMLVLFYLERSSISLQFMAKENKVTKITGPWKEAIEFVLGGRGAPQNNHYDEVFRRQFFDLRQYKDIPLDQFIEIVCDNFKKYQRFTEDGEYQIVPRRKQKAFLKHIISADEPFHFSEVGSGKTKVILPLLCQIFLSNNIEAHQHLARGGKKKDVLVILVPEHLVNDARTQVYRYCLNLNFRDDYRIFDDIMALMHEKISLGGKKKHIFVTSFNQFKKALTYDVICEKVKSHRNSILIVADEVDDFLDRNKLVFNICSNKGSSFDRPTLDLYFETSRAAYRGEPTPPLDSSGNPEYWRNLHRKFRAIDAEIQDASRSINKSFGIFNQHTLRHCSTNIVHDIEGYKSLIARPYESVNRAMPGSYYSDVERTIFLTYVILSEDIAKYNELFQGERKFITFEYWNTHFVHQLDFDDLVYGHESLSELVDKHPETRDGLARFLYEIILRRMEIRDKSRSVNSVDVVFNFDCIGFTGTPFLDNYPTFDYIRHERKDDIPDLIDRSFYAYSSDNLSVSEFESRFAMFQGQNNDVTVKYVDSDFIRESKDEMATLEALFVREESECSSISDKKDPVCFNAIVDLCGIFKRSSVHDVRNLIKKHFGPDRFHFVYHIDQTDSSDRVLCLNSENDVQYDEEFYKHMCKLYGADLRNRIFFFVDNRNVIGKDIPFQLVYQRHFGQPLFTKSVVIAHDVDDFSKIWQAMGRSRTMNDTVFSIYKSDIAGKNGGTADCARDIKTQEITRDLYVQNCDCKIAGNISSIYLTLIALCNLSRGSFYYCDEIVNTFLEKMKNTLSKKVAKHERDLVESVLGRAVPAQILLHILVDKFRRSSVKEVAEEQMTIVKVERLLGHIVRRKYEERIASGDIYDALVLYLSGEQQSLMEISYTKQQQKQKQTQKSKNQDSDTMGIFDRKNQFGIYLNKKSYFLSSRGKKDSTKNLLNLPSPVPILTVTYELEGQQRTINVYPTLQFLYSHHIYGEYISEEVRDSFLKYDGTGADQYDLFMNHVNAEATVNGKSDGSMDVVNDYLKIKVISNLIRQNPLYTVAAISQGVYLIGMKDQFNIHDMRFHPLRDHIEYVVDDMGFVLFDRTNSKAVGVFGPYFIEQYILMELLSKQEVAQNVIEYYCKRKDALDRGLATYTERQGKGFICWRFLMNEAAKTIAAEEASASQKRSDAPPAALNDSLDETASKRQRSDNEDDDEDTDDVADSIARVLDIE